MPWHIMQSCLSVISQYSVTPWSCAEMCRSSSSIAVLQLKGWLHVWPFSNSPCLPQILLHRWSENPSSHWCLPSIVSLVAPYLCSLERSPVWCLSLSNLRCAGRGSLIAVWGLVDPSAVLPARRPSPFLTVSSTEQHVNISKCEFWLSKFVECE